MARPPGRRGNRGGRGSAGAGPLPLIGASILGQATVVAGGYWVWRKLKRTGRNRAGQAMPSETAGQARSPDTGQS